MASVFPTSHSTSPQHIYDSVRRDIETLRVILGEKLAQNFFRNYRSAYLVFPAYQWDLLLIVLSLVKDWAVGLISRVADVASLSFRDEVWALVADNGFYFGFCRKVTPRCILESSNLRSRELRTADIWKDAVFINHKHSTAGPMFEFEQRGVAKNVTREQAAFVAWVWRKWVIGGDVYGRAVRFWSKTTL